MVYYVHCTKEGNITRDASHRDDEDDYLEGNVCKERKSKNPVKNSGEIIDLTIQTPGDSNFIQDASYTNNESDNFDYSACTEREAGEWYASSLKTISLHGSASVENFPGSARVHNKMQERIWTCCDYVAACLNCFNQQDTDYFNFDDEIER